LQCISRLIVRELLDIHTDADIIAHEPVSKEDAAAFAEGCHDGPTLDYLQLDMEERNLPWSRTVIELLTQTFTETVAAFNDIPDRDMAYAEDLFKERDRHLRAAWKVGLTKQTVDGTPESPRETEARVLSTNNAVRARCRQASRMWRVCPSMMYVCAANRAPM
jgi:hypothetical protein